MLPPLGALRPAGYPAADGVDARALPIVIDEVQKAPAVLDEVHWLIENRGLRFVLCGSSARKLKRGRANLLGGRAWRFGLHPLTWPEVPAFDLLRALNRGLIPAHYDSVDHRRALAGYVDDYLKEEVFDEGLTRNVAAFARFFDALAFCHGELVNYSNVARDCGVDSKTVRAYFQILVDTLLGVFVEPFARRRSRAVIARAPKFYLFDVGVAGHLAGRRIERAAGPEFGRALEHLVLMELRAYRSYRERDFPIRFWRTKSGLECDFVLGREGETAIEVKGGATVRPGALRGLRAYVEEHRPRRAVVVCNEAASRRTSDGIWVLPAVPGAVVGGRGRRLTGVRFGRCADSARPGGASALRGRPTAGVSARIGMPMPSHSVMFPLPVSRGHKTSCLSASLISVGYAPPPQGKRPLHSSPVRGRPRAFPLD